MKRLARWLIPLVLLACGAAWWWSLPPPEPMRDGKPLSQWLYDRSFDTINPRPLAPLLSPPDPAVTKWLIYTAEYGDREDHGFEAIKWFLGKLREPSPWPRKNGLQLCTIHVLGELRPAPSAAIPTLLRVLHRNSYDQVAEAAKALHAIGSDSWPAVEEQLAHGSNLVRCELIHYISVRVHLASEETFALEESRVFTSITQALHDPEPNIRRNAASALDATLDWSDGFLPRLASPLVDQAAEALWVLSDDQNLPVRDAKKRVLYYYDETKAVSSPRLTAFLTDSDEAKRRFARSVLDQLMETESH